MRRKVGDPSSKYAYNPDQLDIDARLNHEKNEKLYADFREWMREHEVDARKIRPLFLRFVQEFFNENV